MAGERTRVEPVEGGGWNVFPAPDKPGPASFQRFSPQTDLVEDTVPTVRTENSAVEITSDSQSSHIKIKNSLKGALFDCPSDNQGHAHPCAAAPPPGGSLEDLHFRVCSAAGFSTVSPLGADCFHDGQTSSRSFQQQISYCYAVTQAAIVWELAAGGTITNFSRHKINIGAVVLRPCQRANWTDS